MQDEFANRQAMHRTVVTVLDQPEHKAAWENKSPAIFTTKAIQLRRLVTELETLLREQSNAITGAADRKEREQAELEDKAHEIGQALASYYADSGREDAEVEVSFSRSAWHKLRDEALLGRARLVLDRLKTELATHAAALAPYGLTPADVTALEKEANDYVEVIAAPSGAIAGRKALTQSLRPRFREVSELLQSMDKLILRFRHSDAGRAFADAWEAARVIRDLGAGPKPEVPAPTQ